MSIEDGNTTWENEIAHRKVRIDSRKIKLKKKKKKKGKAINSIAPIVVLFSQ